MADVIFYTIALGAVAWSVQALERLQPAARRLADWCGLPLEGGSQGSIQELRDNIDLCFRDPAASSGLSE